MREERDALAQEVARLRTAREAAERTSQRLRGERNTLREERDSARRDLEVSRQHVAGWCLFRLRKFSSCAAVDALVADVRARNLELLGEAERGRDRLEETEAVVAEISRENSGLPQQLETATTTLSRLAEKDAEPLRKEDGASQGVEAEVAKSDDTDTDTDEDEEAVAARWNNGLGEPTILFSQPDIWEPCSGLDGSYPWIWGRAATGPASPVLPPIRSKVEIKGGQGFGSGGAR